MTNLLWKEYTYFVGRSRVDFVAVDNKIKKNIE